MDERVGWVVRMASKKQTVLIDGQDIQLSNLDKVIYPETGTTKGDVIEYYKAVADAMLPWCSWRPATRKRWVDGVGTEENPGPVFFQKNLEGHAPDWIPRFGIEHKSGPNTYPLVNERATLVWMAQLAALEIHVPQWRFDQDGKQLPPDRLVLDLDPGEGASLRDCVEVALLAKALLEDVGLRPIPVTSGSKGIHLYAALTNVPTTDQASDFAHEVARALESQHPDLIVSDMKKVKRVGKVLVDWSQNNGNKTTVAPYSLRGRPEPMVAAPRTWDELDDPELRHLHCDEVLERLRDGIEPMSALLADAANGNVPDDALSEYRAKRNRGRTPEPIPEAPPTPSNGNSFVIQEHHARRLHWDFRLEHDGVLVSWALPKGVPTDPKRNHLAVHTEDHPLEYGTFEGTIAKGEYGAGTVTIWDHGTFEAHKWRNDEVIATLHGQHDGGLGEPCTFALIHTGEGEEADQWLIHRMDHAPQSHALGGEIPVRPMLATLGREPDIAGANWAHEMKWDGVRTIAEVRDGAVALWSRDGNDVTATYPEVTAALPDAVDANHVILDGEVIALDDHGRPSFGLLQGRMGLSAPSAIAVARKRIPVFLMAFDVLNVDDKSLLDAPYSDRRQRLEQLVKDGAIVHVPPAFAGDLDAAMRSSHDHGLEGIVAKRLDSTYRAGRRSPSWVKIKHIRMQEVVIAGWRPGNGTRSSSVGSLLLGVQGDNGEFVYAGRVGTGFSERQLDEVRRKLEPLSRKTSPFDDVPREVAKDAHWVTPKLVGEVQYTEWTSSGHLRHPTWRGWRPDKRPHEVHREE